MFVASAHGLEIKKHLGRNEKSYFENLTIILNLKVPKLQKAKIKHYNNTCEKASVSN